MIECVFGKTKSILGGGNIRLGGRIVAGLALCCLGMHAGPLLADGKPQAKNVPASAPLKVDPVALLRAVREAQASIKQTLQGKLRKGPKEIVYRMIMEGPRVRFEFPNALPPAPNLVVLQLGEKSSTLAVSGADGSAEKVNYSDEIPGMGVCFEDLSLRFLYWTDAVLEGEESLMLAKCWKIRVRRPAGLRSPYAEVCVWVSQSDAAFLKSESFDEAGVLIRRLTVRQVQSLDGVTTLKQLRIESPSGDRTPTYLDVDGQPTPRPLKK